eukprot:scaffold280281_cov18-Prasinocladus_malaysianus.AAC.1
MARQHDVLVLVPRGRSSAGAEYPCPHTGNSIRMRLDFACPSGNTSNIRHYELWELAFADARTCTDCLNSQPYEVPIGDCGRPRAVVSSDYSSKQ